jgi:hypothetical protein
LDGSEGKSSKKGILKGLLLSREELGVMIKFARHSEPNTEELSALTPKCGDIIVVSPDLAYGKIGTACSKFVFLGICELNSERY